MSDGKAVVVGSVDLPGEGYVAAYEDGDGAPGRLLGSSGHLGAGRHEDVAVVLDEALDGGRVFLILHREDNGNQRFDFPEADAPVGGDDGVMVISIDVEIDD